MKYSEVIPGKRTLSIQPTQQCTAACEHCGTFSSPGTKARLSKDFAEEAIRQAAQEGFLEVAFTGGEPTLSGKWLLQAIELAKSLGLGARLVTNGWWGRTEDLAQKNARSFAEAGLDEITFSTGDQHARFVCVDAVIRGVCAAVRAGMHVSVVVELIKPRSVTRAGLEARPDIRKLRVDCAGTRLNFYESPWMPLNPMEIEHYPNGAMVNASNLGRKGGCGDILQTITIGPDGTVGACCGIGMRLIPALQLGNIADTSIAEATRNADADPLKRWIRAAGPEQILAWAATHDPGMKWENMYAHRCQACIRMYTDPAVQKVLREQQPELFHSEHK